ncbi:MAG TPA: hypothetical protein VJM08_04100, partial [Anaerolineales bacterium]|nr:hypothetical protein [Anaerolineales bacterium]
VAPTAMPDPTATLPTEKPLFVAFAKNGDLHLWDSVSKQSHVVLKSGDVTSVMISDDGQVIAFIRSASSFEPLLVEHSALWAVDSNGENPRELISDETLRQIMNPPPEDSAGFAQISWLPGTHRLVYSTMKFHAPGQGFTNSKDIYVVDADTGSNVVLATDIMPDTPFLNAWSFVISPDSQQIAMFSATELSFINTDGSNLRRAVLTYLTVGMGDAILLPKGVWTKDSTAFVFTGPIESDSPFVLNYTIWRVPADGSQPQSLATIMNSHSNHITFSPDGQRIVFYQDINGDGTIQTEEHRIMPLTAGAGPLALPSSHELVRWSPDGEAFVVKDLDLFQLCPEATNLSEVCGDPIPLASGSNLIDGIGWVDEDRFLYRALEPTSFFLGRLDGTILPIGNWTDDDALEGWSFYVPH